MLQTLAIEALKNRRMRKDSRMFESQMSEVGQWWFRGCGCLKWTGSDDTELRISRS